MCLSCFAIKCDGSFRFLLDIIDLNKEICLFFIYLLKCSLELITDFLKYLFYIYRDKHTGCFLLIDEESYIDK